MSYISIDCTLQLQSTRSIYFQNIIYKKYSSKMCLRNVTKYGCVFTLTAKSDLISSAKIIFNNQVGFFRYYILHFITKSIKYKDFHNLKFYMECHLITEVKNSGISCPTRKVLCLPKIIKKRKLAKILVCRNIESILGRHTPPGRYSPRAGTPPTSRYIPPGRFKLNCIRINIYTDIFLFCTKMQLLNTRTCFCLRTVMMIFFLVIY